MASTPPSLIAGLDPVHLLALGAEESTPAAGNWEPPGLEEVGRLFPAWTAQRLLGRGGMGAVYLMHQPELDRSVAVKLLPLEACREERQVERFRREARTLAKLRHPNIVALYEAGTTAAGHFFFVMEYVDGLPLNQLIATGNVAVPKAIEIVRQVCDALSVAHAAGVVHRDIKPSNILIDQHGQVKVADFGLARWEQPGTEGGMDLSQTGMFMGTAAYAAPEQARDAAHADHRADLYSLGVLLYEMLTGELPRGVFQPPSRKTGSDVRLDEVVQRALQERPEDRYQAATDFKKDVTSVQHAAPAPATGGRRNWWWAFPLSAAVIFGIWMASRPPAASLLVEPVRTVATAGLNKPEVSPPATSPPAASPPEVERPPIKKTPPQSSSPAPAPSGSPQIQRPAQVWSMEPLSPALHPPSALLTEPWKDAALVRQGGAMLCADGSLAYWHESNLGKFQRIALEKPILALAQTPDAILFVDGDAQLQLLDLTQPATTIRLAEQVRKIFPSSSNKWISGIAANGQAMMWSMTPPFTSVSLKISNPLELIVKGDGSVYALNGDGDSFRVSAEQEAQKIPLPAAVGLCAVGNEVFVLTKTHQVWQVGKSELLSDLKDIASIVGSDSALIAVDSTGRVTQWNPSQAEPPQRFRIPDGRTRLRVSPVGLMAAW